MEGQYWTVLMTIGFFIGFVALTVAFVFFIYGAIQLKKMVECLNDFCKTTDERLKPVLEETEKTMKSIRAVTDNVRDGHREYQRSLRGSVRCRWKIYVRSA